MRKAAWALGGVGAGLTGWAAGTYRSERREVQEERAFLLQNARVQHATAKLEAMGYIVEKETPSMLLQLHRQHMFTQAVLTGRERLHAEGPFALRHPETGALATVFHLGSELQSKDGFAAACTVLFDEALAMAAFPRLPNAVGVTGTLELGPVRGLPPTDGLVVLHARPTTAKGRRSESEGELYALSTGTLLASGHVVMVEPWWGKYIALLL